MKNDSLGIPDGEQEQEAFNWGSPGILMTTHYFVLQTLAAYFIRRIKEARKYLLKKFLNNQIVLGLTYFIEEWNVPLCLEV